MFHSEHSMASAPFRSRRLKRPPGVHWRRSLPIVALWIAGCTVGPPYVKPPAEVPASYKEGSQDFKQARPSDEIARGKWWEIYNDLQLNELEEQIRVSNQTLKAAEAQFAAARAAIRVARAQSFP